MRCLGDLLQRLHQAVQGLVHAVIIPLSEVNIRSNSCERLDILLHIGVHLEVMQRHASVEKQLCLFKSARGLIVILPLFQLHINQR